MHFRKIAVLLLIFSMLLYSFVGCGNEEMSKPSGGQDDSSDVQGGDDSADTPTQDKPGDSDEEQKPDEPAPNDDVFTPLVLQNALSKRPISMRTFYPDTMEFIRNAETLRAAIQNGQITDNNIIVSELTRLLKMNEDLGLYYDYAAQPFVMDNEQIFGAKPDDNPIGGGEGYNSSYKKATMYVSTDDELKNALLYAKSGDVIVVRGAVCIDMSDFICAGDYTGFTGQRIPLDMVIPAGVVLRGERGENGDGAIIKVTSYTNILFTLKKGARLSGLVIQGPDNAYSTTNAASNLSVGIRIEGSNARVDNCEISGFYHTAIEVDGVKGVRLDHNYFHHIDGINAGTAIRVKNATVNIEYNLFSAVRSMVYAAGSKADVTFKNNVDVGNLEGVFFKLGTNGSKKQTTPFPAGIKSFVAENNLFLSLTTPVELLGLPQNVAFKNNLFGYDEQFYDFSPETIENLDQTVYDTFIFQNNAFDVRDPFVASRSAANPEKSEDVRLGSYSQLVADKLTAYNPEINPYLTVEYETILPLPVLSASYFTPEDDLYVVYLEQLRDFVDLYTTEKLCEELRRSTSICGGYSQYLEYVDRNLITVTVKNQIYGAYADEMGEVGGGVGYKEIYTTGDYVVTDYSSLKSALKKAKKGQVVFIPGGTVIELSEASSSEVNPIYIGKGVTLASDRGYINEDGTISTGAILKVAVFSKTGAVYMEEDNARLTGLVVMGPDPSAHEAHHTRSFNLFQDPLAHKYYYQLITTDGVIVKGSNIEIDNCEITSFSHGGIYVQGKNKVASKNIHIHHNYIHHCRLKGLGYGVSITYGYITIDHNYFNYNRHSIAASGYENSGYKAYCNIEFGESVSDYFDFHGGKDRKDGTDIAGQYCDIYNNTFLGSNNPYNLRGIPTERRTFKYNMVYEPIDFYGSYLSHYSYKGIVCPNTSVGKNIWNIRNGNTKVETGYPGLN